MLLLSLSAKSIFVPDTLTSENSSGLWEDENFITGSILTICKEKKKIVMQAYILTFPTIHVQKL